MKERKYRIYNLVLHWVDANFNETAYFLRELAPSVDRDRAVEIFARSAVDLEPPSAVDWAMEIENETLRGKTLEGIYEEWAKEDREGADGYFAEKGVVVQQATVQ